MTQTGPEMARRFYKSVAVAPEDGGFAVQLDGRTPRSPAGARLIVPTQALAELVAEEWEAQKEHINPSAMPATRLAFTAIDRVSLTRAEVADQMADYAGSDLICYFAEAPAGLVQRQEAAWGPMLSWAEAELGLPLARASGIVHQAQPAEVAETVRALALAEDDFALCALAHATALLGSAVLALAMRRGRLSGQDAFALAHLDELFQAEQWGEDEEAADRRRGLLAECALVERWFGALGEGC